MEPLQTTLIIVLIILTISFVVLCAVMVMTLLQLQKSIKSLDGVLNNLYRVSNLVSDPITPLLKIASSFIPESKALRSLLSNSLGKSRKDKENV